MAGWWGQTPTGMVSLLVGECVNQAVALEFYDQTDRARPFPITCCEHPTKSSYPTHVNLFFLSQVINTIRLLAQMLNEVFCLSASVICTHVFYFFLTKTLFFFLLFPSGPSQLLELLIFIIYFFFRSRELLFADSKKNCD